MKITHFPIKYITSIWMLHSLMTSFLSHKGATAFSVVNKKSISLPEAELVNRRKSPALWREDETLRRSNQGSQHSEAKPLIAAKTSSSLPRRPPEVMAPCGGFPQLEAAIANGADSVYLGLSAFSARARASNFSPPELVKAVSMAHKYGVKVYVALNTLVFQTELHEVAEWIRICDVANVDALIVQDFGVTKLAKKIAPNLEIHASTQQTVTNTDGVMYAKERGSANRVVLGRELSINEIRSVTKDIQELGEEEVEVETFVHGALCVSYSGQCFSSEAWGGRSANRGQCAQACRLPYGLIQDGELKDLQDMSYLLSPQDLCGLDQVEDLVRAGVSCLKIEGRLKDEAYVAATTRAYRNAVDVAWAKIQNEQSNSVKNDRADAEAFVRGRILESHEEITKTELAQLFSRGQDEEYDGLSPGFFEGSLHQKIVRGRSPRHRGIYVGKVLESSSSQDGLVIASKVDLKRGDGIVVDRGMPEEPELGGPIFDVQEMKDGTIVVRFSKGVEKEWKKSDDASRRGLGTRTPMAPVGATVWRSSDAIVDKKMKKLIGAAAPRGIVSIKVSGSNGSPIKVEICDLITGKVGIGESKGALVEAEQKGIDEKSIRKAIGTLGNTQWILSEDENSLDFSEIEDNLWCPISWVKKARQAAVEDLTQSSHRDQDGIQLLDDSLLTVDRNGGSSADVVDQMIAESSSSSSDNNGDATSKTAVAVLARSQEQVDALCAMIRSGHEIDEIIIDFLEVDGMREAVAIIRQMGDDTRVVLATSRIIKPGEEGIWKSLLKLEPDGLLIRSAGLIHKLSTLGGEGADIVIGDQCVQIPQLIGDFSLNTINSITSNELLDYGKLRRITAAYDLSANAITELATAMGPSQSKKLEVIAHAHLPIFHTEHCVFARFLTKGNSYLDCGHACTRHNVHLRDQAGKDNLVLADMGCRNTVFSAEAQSGIYSLQQWSEVGVGTIRIELVDEGKKDVQRIVEGYLNVLDGKEKPSAVWGVLEKVVDSNGRYGGVSFGSLRNGVERRAGEIV